MFSPQPFHPSRPRQVAPVRVDPTGETGPTRKQARGPRWRQTSYGFYVPVAVDGDEPCQRAVEASAVLQPGEGVTGWAGLAWLGARWFSGTTASGDKRPVPIVTTRHVAHQPGFQVSQEYLRPGHVEIEDGLPITGSARSVCFEMRHASTLTEAVVAMDMAAYSDLVSIEEAWQHNDTLWTWYGVPLSRKAIALADENSWSPQEVVMRLVWTIQAERPRPLCNVPVFDRFGRHVGTPDLLDPVAGVAGEYDSDLHLIGSQRARDLRREGAFRALGLEYVTMVGGDRADGYRSFLLRLATAYQHAAYAADGARPWTIVPPRWWIDTTTVAARRALDPVTRDTLLRHRRAA